MNYDILIFKEDDNYEKDLSINKEVFDKEFMERFSVLESNIWLIKSIKNLAIEKEKNYHVVLWNVVGYLNLLSYDLASVGYCLVFEKKRWQKVFFARQVVLIIYEALEDIPEILGKDYKTIFSNMAIADNYLRQLNLFKKELQEFKKHNVNKLRLIRMNVSAHRDKDINMQLDIIQEIDPYEIIRLMIEFESILRNITDHLQRLAVNTIGASK